MKMCFKEKNMNYAVYTASRNLYQDLLPAVKSLIINSSVDKVFFLIEDDKFPEELPDMIECINVSNQKFFAEDGPNMRSRFTYLAMMRATLAKLFPDIDQIFSLDVDTIIDKPIGDVLWKLPLDDYYFSASKEPFRTDYEKLFYTNTGVAMYNLKKLRDGKVDEVIAELNRKQYSFLEQDVFNYLCQGHILDMPSCYNANDWTMPTYDKKIVHYAGIKEWNHYPLVAQYRSISWDRIIK